MSCICKSSNKFFEKFGSCRDLTMIDLDVQVPKWETDCVVYKIKNIGVKSICGNLHVCSKLFGMIEVKNELLLPGSELVHRHNFGDMRIPGPARESARVFARVYEGIYIHSDKFKKVLPLGIAPASVNIIWSSPETFLTTVTNRMDASMTMRGASVKIKFFGLFNRSNFISIGQSPGEVLEDGILYRIPDLPPGQTWSFGPVMRLTDAGASVNNGEPVIISYEYQFNEFQIETWELQPISVRFLTVVN